MVTRIRKALARQDQGFTLIELLVVILIIGVLAAVAIPLFLKQRKKAIDAGIIADVKNADTAVETYSVDSPAAATLTVADAQANGFRLTPGNTVEVTGSPAIGYCVLGWNTESDKHSDRGSAIRYDSIAGGINKWGGACTKPRPPAVTTGSADCGYASGQLTISCAGGYANRSVISINEDVHSSDGPYKFSLRPPGDDCAYVQGWDNSSNPIDWGPEPQQFTVCGGTWQTQAEYVGVISVPGRSAPATRP